MIRLAYFYALVITTCLYATDSVVIRDPTMSEDAIRLLCHDSVNISGFVCEGYSRTSIWGSLANATTLQDVRSATGPSAQAGYVPVQVESGGSVDSFEYARPEIPVASPLWHQYEAPRHLAELQRSVDGSSYQPPGSASSATIYVLGEAVDATNPDVFGRVNEGLVDDDHRAYVCDFWQGTHVASVSAGTVFGVAKAANVMPIVAKKGCHSESTAKHLLSAMQIALEHRKHVLQNDPRAPPAIAIIIPQLTVSVFDQVAVSVVEDILRDLSVLGVISVSTAGDMASDACNFSPARSKYVMTVGALDNGEHTAARMLSTSNRGPCVDVWARGKNVLGAATTGSKRSRGGVLSMTGTAQAAAVVAGAAAVASDLAFRDSSSKTADVVATIRSAFEDAPWIQDHASIMRVPKDWVVVRQHAS